MSKLVRFYKPYLTLSQFTDRSPPATQKRATLADFITLPAVYPIGRLDYDSEGLLLLTDNGQLQHYIAHPTMKMPKTYWVQVEGVPSDSALNQLQHGVLLKDGWTQPALVKRLLSPPKVAIRQPPIRFRAHIATDWLAITIYEGRNRQIRRMTAHINHPTLRLIRVRIGPWRLNPLQPGQWQVIKHPMQ